MTVHRQAIETIVDRITTSPAPIVVLGVGIPASGKSTILNALGDELGIRPVNVDGILRRTKSEGWVNGSYDKFQDRVRADAANNMRLGGVALIDAPHCDVEYRRADIEFYRSIGAQTIGAVQMDIDPEIAIQRDAQRAASERQGSSTIAFMHTSLHSSPPEPKDGFDWIEKISVQLGRQ
jgi:predicted kinase